MRHAVCTIALSITLCFGGCGRLGFDSQDRQGNGPDAGSQGDAGARADADPNPLIGPASITLLSPTGTPRDQPVVFHNPDGSLLSLEQTDNTGQAARDIPENAMITIVGEHGLSLGGGGGDSSGLLLTFMGVQPGNALRNGTDKDPWQSAARVEATLPGTHPGAAYYIIPTGCGEHAKTDAMSPAQFQMSGACLDDASSLDLMALAIDADETLIAYTVVNGVEIAEDTTYINFPAWETDCIAVQLDLNNGPPTASSANAAFSLVHEGVPYLTGLGSDGLSGGDGTMTFYTPRNFGTAAEYLLSVDHQEMTFARPKRAWTVPAPVKLGGTSSSGWTTFIQQRQSGVAKAHTVDLTDDLLPAINNLWIEGDVAERSRVELVPAGDLSMTDGAVVVVAWANPPDWSYHQWWIMIPPGTTEFQLPELPDSLAAYRPRSDSVLDTPYVLVFDFDFLNGYGDMLDTYGFNLFAYSFDQPRANNWLMRAATGPGGFPYSIEPNN